MMPGLLVLLIQKITMRVFPTHLFWALSSLNTLHCFPPPFSHSHNAFSVSLMALFSAISCSYLLCTITFSLPPIAALLCFLCHIILFSLSDCLCLYKWCTTVEIAFTLSLWLIILFWFVLSTVWLIINDELR